MNKFKIWRERTVEITARPKILRLTGVLKRPADLCVSFSVFTAAAALTLFIASLFNLKDFSSLGRISLKTITLYIVSSSINPVDIERAKGINSVEDYLVKPVTIEDLESIFLKEV